MSERMIMDNFPDFSDSQLKFINGVHGLSEMADEATAGIDKVLEGGTFQGIPDKDILEAFDALKAVIEVQTDFIKGMTETVLEFFDGLEKTYNDYSQ
jgi:hypothetical protein